LRKKTAQPKCRNRAKRVGSKKRGTWTPQITGPRKQAPTEKQTGSFETTKIGGVKKKKKKRKEKKALGKEGGRRPHRDQKPRNRESTDFRTKGRGEGKVVKFRRFSSRPKIEQENKRGSRNETGERSAIRLTGWASRVRKKTAGSSEKRKAARPLVRLWEFKTRKGSRLNCRPRKGGNGKGNPTEGNADHITQKREENCETADQRRVQQKRDYKPQ